MWMRLLSGLAWGFTAPAVLFVGFGIFGARFILWPTRFKAMVQREHTLAALEVRLKIWKEELTEREDRWSTWMEEGRAAIAKDVLGHQVAVDRHRRMANNLHVLVQDLLNYTFDHSWRATTVDKRLAILHKASEAGKPVIMLPANWNPREHEVMPDKDLITDQYQNPDFLVWRAKKLESRIAKTDAQVGDHAHPIFWNPTSTAPKA